MKSKYDTIDRSLNKQQLREKYASKSKGENEIIDIDDKTVAIALSQGKLCFIDRADMGIVKNYHWFAHRNGKTFYCMTHDWDKNGKRVFIAIHRLLINVPKGMQIDHVDRNGLNNTRKNLRECSPIENSHNKGVTSANKSGYKGVSFYTKHNKWRASLKCNGKEYYGGIYSCRIAAAYRYDQIARQVFGEFAYTNFIK